MYSSDEVTYYGLLFVSKYNNHTNMKKNGTESIDIYCANAALCSASAAAAGVRFRLITNAATDLRSRFARMKLPTPEIIEEEFSLEVPEGADFFAAHFKIDVLKLFGTGKFGEYVGLIDLDTIFLRSVFVNPIFDGKICVYDISNQTWDEKMGRILKENIRFVAGANFDKPRWYGGEFIVGHKILFEILSRKINEFADRYFANIENMGHVGDEMLVSAALNSIESDDPGILFDVGSQHEVTRWWSSRTLRRQKRFGEIENSALLHLPSDKEFLALLARRAFSVANFLECYKRHINRRKRALLLYNFFASIFSDQKKYVPET